MDKKQEYIFIAAAVVIAMAGAFAYYGSLSSSSGPVRGLLSDASFTYPISNEATTSVGADHLSKQQIIALVSSGQPLSVSDKKLIFVSIAGMRIEEYKFSTEEKVLIIESLNQK